MDNISVLIIAVTYNSDDQAINLLKEIDRLSTYGINLELILVDNTEAGNGKCLKDATINKKIKVQYIKPLENLGYLGGASYALNEYVQNNKYPDWLIVCNVDLHLIDKDMLYKLVSITDNNIGLIAPSIISTITGIDKNPAMMIRPNSKKFILYKIVFSNNYMYNMYAILSYVKAWFNKLFIAKLRCNDQEIHSKKIYAPHGSFIIINKRFFEQGGTLNYPMFLFNEEIFLAESARKSNLDILYYPAIKILDDEHVSTGIFRSKSIVKYMHDSSNFIYNTYFAYKLDSIKYVESSMPESSNICAVIVTYNPEDILSTIQSIVDKVGRVLIVDNGSLLSDIDISKFDMHGSKLHIINNYENKGVASALNAGVMYAIENGFSWLLTLDQDSICLPNIVNNFKVVYASYVNKERIGLISTNYIEKNVGTTAIHKRKNTISTKYYHVLDEVITSGSLMSLKALKNVGMFRDDLFIYYVDHEICARLRYYGYKILMSKDVGMIHSTGNCTANSICGYRFIQTNYSPINKYYIARNPILLFKQYYKSAPLWSFRLLIYSFKKIAKSIIFEDKKLLSLKHILYGQFHGILGKGGKLR